MQPMIAGCRAAGHPAAHAHRVLGHWALGSGDALRAERRCRYVCSLREAARSAKTYVPAENWGSGQLGAGLGL